MHEIGHGYGFAHTPCGNGGTADPNYPTYEPYTSASIGEYGLDIADGSIMSPAGIFDYMSYCFPQWMSLYQHNRLILHPRLGQEWIRDDLIWERYLRWREYWIPRDLPDPPPDPYRWIEMRLDPVIAISGIVRGREQVEVTSVARVPAAGSPPGQRTSMSARLLDAEGATMATGTVYRLSTHGGCGCGDGGGGEEDEQYPFEAYVPDVERGAALVIEDGENEVWVRRAPEKPPEVGKVEAGVTDDGRLTVRWESDTSAPETSKGSTSDSEGRPGAWAQWSADDGKSWRALATGLTGGEATLDLGGVSSGPVLIRLLVHDGFSTAVSEPTGVEVPERPPEVAILHPEDGALITAGGVLRAWASVTEPDGTPPSELVACRWLLDGREVATETDAWLEAPEPGDHRLTLIIGGKGGEVERSVKFTCRPGPGHDSDEDRPTKAD
jgi:hypothetical protein